jgi:hypothetical protein
MDDYLNLYLGKILKNWAGRRKAPDQIRKRLLLQAAYISANGKSREYRPIVVIPKYQPVRWDHLLHSCDIVYSYQNGLTVSRMLV